MPTSDRREVGNSRTLRPAGAEQDHGAVNIGAVNIGAVNISAVNISGLAALPTVAEAIADPAFVAGDPEVVAGHGALSNKVRWVHASDNADVARFFAGGELLISTGQGWPHSDAALDAFVEGLGAAGIAGIVVELGTRFTQAPRTLLDAADRIGLPLVVLRSEVRFVDLTEAIHRRIIGSQMEALRAHADVRERFTALALRGAPADHVVAQLARTLASPVILENLAHQVVAAEVIDGADADVLADWERRSRAAAAVSPAPAPGETDWLIVPVDARGTRWGTLVALPGAAHPAGRLSVLEQGAIALAIGCLAAGGADEWNHIARRGLLEALLEGRFATTADAAARLEAAGLPVAGRTLHGIAVSSPTATAQEVEAAARASGGVARALPLDSTQPGVTVALLSVPSARGLDHDSAQALLKAIDGGPRATLTIGRPATGIDEALASMRDAIDHSASRLTAPDRTGNADAGGRILWADERPLAHLLNSLRDDHRLLDHGERMLAPLIEHDARTGGDLQRVLAAMLAHPSNRTAAARASHLSRSVFYQRLAILGSLLDADLDDGETQTALHIALLARRGK